jgi:hypothetical protein
MIDRYNVALVPVTIIERLFDFSEVELFILLTLSYYGEEGLPTLYEAFKAEDIDSAMNNLMSQNLVVSDDGSIRLNVDGQVQTTRPKRKRAQKSPDTYGPKDWQYVYATRWRDTIDDSADEAKLNNWAKDFDKVANKYGKDKLDLVLWWLFKYDDWWLSNNAIRSPSKFLVVNKENETWFEVFIVKAKRAKDQSMVKLPEANMEVGEVELEKILAHHGEKMRDKFLMSGYDRENNKRYIYKP